MSLFPITAYTAVDVETPNWQSDALCSIAVVHVEYGRECFAKEYLVDPEVPFALENVAIHGITPAMVAGAPTFPAVWEQIRHYFENGIVMAHSAGFDLGVISNTLARYGVTAPYMHYICTCQKARKHIEKQEYGNHKLNTLCTGLHVALDHHHNALCDARACAGLYEVLVDKFGSYETDVKQYIPPQRRNR